MSKTLKIVLIIINCCATIVFAVWTYSTYFELEPLGTFIVSIATLLALIFSKTNESNNKKISNSKNVIQNSNFGNIGGNLHVGDSKDKIES